jgi:excisionase family DNA binding protein
VTKPKTEPTEVKRLLTVREAAQVLGFKTPNPVYKLIASGHLPTVDLPIRGGTRIDQKDLDEFLVRRKRIA